MYISGAKFEDYYFKNQIYSKEESAIIVYTVI